MSSTIKNLVIISIGSYEGPLDIHSISDLIKKAIKTGNLIVETDKKTDAFDTALKIEGTNEALQKIEKKSRGRKPLGSTDFYMRLYDDMNSKRINSKQAKARIQKRKSILKLSGSFTGQEKEKFSEATEVIKTANGKNIDPRTGRLIDDFEH